MARRLRHEGEMDTAEGSRTAHNHAESLGLATLPLLLCAFGVFGAMMGSWQALLPDLSGALSLSPGPLGAALSIGLGASIPLLLLGGRAVDRFGVRLVIIGAGTALALVLVGIATVKTFVGLIALLMVYFSAIGLYDIGINAAAVRLEQRWRRRIVPYCHAAFSGGAATGALGSGLLVAQALPFRSVYLAIALLFCGALVWVWYGPLPATESATHHTDRRGDDPRLTRNTALWIAAGISALSFISEAAIESWSALYLRTTLDLPALLGATGIAVFHLAMTVGRLSTAGILTRLRRLTLLRVAGCLGAAGIALTLATTSPPLILCGFLLTGLSFSGIVPVAVSLAGDLLPGRSGQATSLVFSVSYASALIGPGVTGGIAEATNLRTALGLIIVTGGLISLLTLLPAARRQLDR